jgi:hypothetical protein
VGFLHLSPAQLLAVCEPDLVRQPNYSVTGPPCMTNRIYQNVANALYFDYGRRLAAAREWNDMTRLQMTHELKERGMLSDEETELSDYTLRMRMVRATLEEQGERERMERMRAKLREEDREMIRGRKSEEKKEKGVESMRRKREGVEVGVVEEEEVAAAPQVTTRVASRVSVASRWRMDRIRAPLL